MKLNKIVKTALVGLAIVGATLAAGCGAPKATKDMNFDEVMDDWGKNIQTVVSTRDKMVEDYIKKDPETYKIFTITEVLDATNREKDIDALHLTKEQIDKADDAITEIKNKTQPEVDRIKEDSARALEIIKSRTMDKDQNKFNADATRRVQAEQKTFREITAGENKYLIVDATKFGKVRYNVAQIRLLEHYRSQEKIK